MSFQLNSQAREWPYEQVKDNANAPNFGWEVTHRPNNAVIKSNMVLFLDVDGVLAHPGQDLYQCPGLEACTEIAMQTKCDVVISSGWQFNPSKFQHLRIFLETCGFERDQIHSVKDLMEPFYGMRLTSKMYNQPPSTLTRSMYIRAIIKYLQRGNPYVRCMILDDMHLSSTSYVKVLPEYRLPFLIDQLSETIFECRSFADADRDEFMNDSNDSITLPFQGHLHPEDARTFHVLNTTLEDDMDAMFIEDCKTPENRPEDICTNSDTGSCAEDCMECLEVNESIRRSIAQALYDFNLPQDRVLFGSVNCLYGILDAKDAVTNAMHFVDDVIVKALWHESFKYGEDQFFRKYRDSAYRRCWNVLYKFVENSPRVAAGLPDLESYFRRVNPYELVTVEDRNAVIRALVGRRPRKEWRHTYCQSPSPDRKTAD